MFSLGISDIQSILFTSPLVMRTVGQTSLIPGVLVCKSI